MQSIGNPRFKHLHSSVWQPLEAMRRLASDELLNEGTVARMPLHRWIGYVDNPTPITCLLFNTLWKPIGMPCSQIVVWHGYRPHSPATAQKQLIS